MYYLIRESLTPCVPEEIRSAKEQFVAILTGEEWKTRRDSFGMIIDMDMETANPRETKAVVNLDSLTGTFSFPDRQQISGPRHNFSFALDERGIILVDDTGYAERTVAEIGRTKKWRLPSLERFLYDLLEVSIRQDLSLLEGTEHRLNKIEEAILSGEIESYPPEMNDIRGDLLDLRVHYEQLIDLGQELEENENGYFREENLRYFHMFTERVARLQDMVMGQREYITQLRDLMQTQLDVRQNRIMTVLTVITSIFLPLTLIAGWYGMNFRYMPELEWKYSYPVLIGISILIVVLCLVWFRKKKWM
ncbi:MAG: magnesium transporter CorA [Clostridia bacterium]|nr:magnesium transporter CorA [Clostridia bacterium]MBR5366716.1 magnesium transporter CorA [Clostridia bacterium]